MIEYIILTAFFSLAVHVSFTWPSMLFKQQGDWLFTKLPQFITKPLFACLPCMGFWYCLFLGVLVGNDINTKLLITSVAAIGANTVLALLFRLIEAVENLERFDDEVQGTPEK